MKQLQNSFKIKFLLALLVIPPFMLFLVQKLFPPNFLISSSYKIIFLIPFFYRKLGLEKSVKAALLEGFCWKKFKEKLGVTLLLGLGLSGVYLAAFGIFKSYLNLETIAAGLGNTAGTSAKNIVFIGLYIIVFNSVLEEYFWRGFVFKELKSLIKPWIAYGLTGVAFSLHHIMFYYNWFTLSFFMLATIGLIIFAVLMNLFFAKFQDLFSCWLIHGLVDTVQIYIGLKVFGVW